MDNAGYAALQIIPSFKGFESKLDQGTSSAMRGAGTKGGAAYGEAAGKSAGSRFNRIFVGAAKLGLAGVVGGGIAAFKLGKDAISQASDLNESLNAVNVTYDKQAAAVKKLGREAAESLGLSNTEFNGLAVQFSAFATQVAGGEGPKVIGVLDELTTRGADFASVMNLEVNEALGLFQSGLAGETEPLRKFGIDLSAAAVQAHAVKVGIASGKKELTESQKVQARYSLLMEQTSKTQGDFVNTSDSLANSQRRLSARWDNAQAKLGKALLPAMEDLVGLLLDKGIPAVERFGDWFAEEGVAHIEKFAGHVKDAAGFVKDLAGFINDIPTGDKLSALGAVLGTGAALKLRGGSGGGALGTAGSALGLSKPVPVFVTNPGFAGGATGAGGAAGKGAKTGTVGRGAGSSGLLAALPFLPEIVREFQYPFTKKGQGEIRDDVGGFGRLGMPAMFGRGTDFKSDFGGFVKNAVDSAAEVTKAFGSLPEDLQTKITLGGVPESKAAVRELIAQYDLTPKQKRTLFEMAGFETARARSREIIQQYNLTPKEKRTLFGLDGYATTLSQINNIEERLNEAARDRRTTITLQYARLGHDTKGGIQRAAGGPVFGPGSGTSDSIPAWLSNGEHVWTAREVANAGGHAAVEALRRRFRYAEGGAVGGVPRVSVGDTHLRVFIGEREIHDVAVRAANGVVNAQLSHDDLMGRRPR